MEAADLCEVESRYPEDGRFAVVHPVLEKLESLEEVIDVTPQRLQTGVGALCPVVWHLEGGGGEEGGG